MTKTAGEIAPLVPASIYINYHPIRRSVDKISRNDPCRCGSGKKYKRCCFDTDRERLSFSSPIAGKTQAELRVAPETGLTECRLKTMGPQELACLDPRKVPSSLRPVYIMQCAGLQLLGRSAEAMEVMTFDNDDDFEQTWNYIMYFVMLAQDKDIAGRMVAARAGHKFKKDVPDRYLLLLARDDPAVEIRVLGDLARKMLVEIDPHELSCNAYALLCSRFTALGILVCRGFIASLGRKRASFLLERVLEARDKLNLPPEDPFSDVLEKRLAEETSDEGADAAQLHEARQRLDAKAAEIRALKEEIDNQGRKLDRQERAQREKAAAPQPTPSAPDPANDAALRELRDKLARHKAMLGERTAERLALRHELEKAHDELETLRQGNATLTASASATEDGAGEDEEAFYLPAQVDGNQPLRLVEYPLRFARR